MTLFSYCLRHDNGAAPNPFWGICTLAICKPVIRRTAQMGDWVVGLGSKDSPMGSTSVVYAMKVTGLLPMEGYDTYCGKSLPGKIPDWGSKDFSRKVGDCIYDYGHSASARLRRSVHSEGNRERDLSGRNVLLSRHFYYFGDQPVDLPKNLRAIVHSTQGQKSRANDRYTASFVTWIEGAGYLRNVPIGKPQLKGRMTALSEAECRRMCSKQHQEEDEQD